MAFLIAACQSCAMPKAVQLYGVGSRADSQPKDRALADMKRIGVLRADFQEWYVSPNARPAGLGTLDSPVDLPRIFSGDLKKVRPGDVVWIRGGIYDGPFTSLIEGSSELPIVIRQYPGERAILRKASNVRARGTLDVRGDNVWFWDLEVTNSSTDRDRHDPDGKLNPMRGSGVNIYAANTRYINLIVHDNGHGFGLWNEDGGTEIYGCLIFNNGNNKKEHGVYGHNKHGSHAIRNNIIFNNAGYGLHLYANSTKSSVSGFDVDRNTVFNNGALTLVDQVADQILIGGVEGVPAERVSLVSNYIFNEIGAPTSKNRGIRLGYRDKGNKDAKLIENYVVSKVALRILWWQSVEARENTIYSDRRLIEIQEPPIHAARQYRFDSNVYLGSSSNEPNFLLNEKNLNLASWRNGLDFTRNSTTREAEGVSAFVDSNRYDPTRATVTIFNWSKKATVPIELGSFLKKGDRYEIRDAQDPLGKPVVGVFNSQPVPLRMDLREIAMPIGKTEAVPQHSGLEFGVFLIEKKGGDSVTSEVR